MRTLLLIFFPLNLFAQTWQDTIPDWDHTDKANIKIQYSGEWEHMIGNIGSFPMSDSSIAQYDFWGQRIDIYTEIDRNHSYYIVNLDGIDLDTIFVKGRHNKSSMTFSIDSLSYNIKTGYNHVIKLRSNKKHGFVLKYFIKHVDSSPWPMVITPPNL